MSPDLSLPLQNADELPETFSADWWVEILLDIPLKIALLIVGGVLTRFALHKIIDRVVARMAAEPPAQVFGSARAARFMVAGAGGYSERRALRAKTIGSLLKSVVTGVVAAVVVVMGLEIAGYPVGPLLASAGIVGLAIGFGAQNLVKDFISGLSMLLEDQYGVGDVIDMGEASGTVEAVGMRVTRLRAVDGTVWYVRNGEVVRVGNSSQDWARAVVDVAVGYSEEPRRVRELLLEIAHSLADDEEFAPLLLEQPEVWGVEQLAADSVVMRLVVKTRPLEQWKVARELRERIKARFDAEGIEIPFPQRSLWIRDERQGDEREENG
jgi:small conductance mechanosensitive channel